LLSGPQTPKILKMNPIGEWRTAIYLLAGLSVSSTSFPLEANAGRRTLCIGSLLEAMEDHLDPRAVCGYKKGYCSDNVVKVLDQIESGPYKNVKANVLYIFPKSLGNDLVPNNPRNPIHAWQFHAVLEVNGMIVDPDFGPSPVLIRPEKYFEKMFGKGNVAFNQMLVSTIAPSQYREGMKRKGPEHYCYHLYDDKKRASAQTVEGFLKERGLETPRQERPRENIPPDEYGNRVYGMIKANRPDFRKVAQGKPVTFQYNGMFGQKLTASGTLVSAGDFSVSIRLESGELDSIPYALIWPDSLSSPP
jgi:hypothetical protein